MEQKNIKSCEKLSLKKTDKYAKQMSIKEFYAVKLKRKKEPNAMLLQAMTCDLIDGNDKATKFMKSKIRQSLHGTKF